MITSARDHEVQLLWTVHDQFMLVHKSDTRDKSEQATQSVCGILDLFKNFYNCLV